MLGGGMGRWWLALVIVWASVSAQAAYETNIQGSVAWLSAQQNADGSWGAGEAVQSVFTAEAVQALGAAGARNGAYYAGLTWLENHAAPNHDLASRRAGALAPVGADVSALLADLQSEQDTARPGRSGWGLTPAYLQAPADTALVLTLLSRTGAGGIAIQPALDYLQAAQLGPGDWGLGAATTADPFSTALTVRALALWQGQDPGLATVVTNGVTALTAAVGTGAPAHLQALAAQAVLQAGDAAAAQPWLDALATLQAGDGGLGGRLLDTALALRAFAVADGLDAAALRSPVFIPDANLRQAINQTLGRNAIDTLDRRELAQLTTLSAVDAGISDLTGLEFAINLTTLDVRNNDITSTAPIDGLTNLTTALLDGNPLDGDGSGGGGGGGSTPSTTVAVPALPVWALGLLALLLAGLGARSSPTPRPRSHISAA